MFWNSVKKIIKNNKLPHEESGDEKGMTIKKNFVSAKKTTPKIIVAKQISQKTQSEEKKELVIAPAEMSFWVHNGVALYSLADLEKELARMDKDQFEYHVKRNGNDFSKWVLLVLHDNECAIDLEKSKTQKGAHTAVKKHLEKYIVKTS